jgi:hypothetical protein
MLSIYEYKEQQGWDEDALCKCCDQSKPTPPDPPGSDCCYNTWQAELKGVTWEYNKVTRELAHVQKYLDLITTRTTRLKTWFDELYTANELAKKICHQLEIIEAQVINICINTEFTVEGIQILYCMIREFYVEIDCLTHKYEYLINCIKCQNNPSLSLTQGIGKVISDYGAQLAVLTATRDNLIKLVMGALAMANQLHWEICDSYGFRRLIGDWQKLLHCGEICEPIPMEGHHHDPDAPVSEKECLFPLLEFPICNTSYYKLIDRLYKKDKEKMHELTEKKQKLTKKQLALAACQQSLTTALKEVGTSVTCS